MTAGTNRRGSVLIMALWIIAVLSVMVVSFAFEARQQAGIDIYVRERNRVSRLVDSGRMLGEAVLTDYENAPDPEIKGGSPDWKDAFEEDRWVIEKYDLKSTDKCVIGPIRLDEPEEEDDEETGTITVEISAESAAPKIDINSFCEDVDKNYVSRFQTILTQSGITEEMEVEVEDANRSGKSRHNLMNLLIASWKDWRDEDDTVSRGPLTDSEYNPKDDDGAEKTWYEERDEEDEIPVAERRIPPNGPIKKLEELSYIRGFRDFPAVLTGGLLFPKEKESEENPRLTGILDRLKVSGGMKLQLNDETTVSDLMTLPGIFPDDPEDESAKADGEELAAAILGALKTMPEEDDDVDETRTWWPFKDFQDLCDRVDDYGCDVDVPEDIREYIEFPGGKASSATAGKTSDSKGGSASEAKKYSMTITGESMGMKYVVTARCYVADKKVRYFEWNENDVTK